VIRWIADRTRCTVTMSDAGMTQIAHHESSTDGVSWTASMDVTLRKVAAPAGLGALGPAVGNDIGCALTWCAALTMGHVATCRFAFIFR